MEVRYDFVTLGRKIGTHSGTYSDWDEAGAFSTQVYDFEPLEGIDLPKTDCLTFDLKTGRAIWFDSGLEDEENVSENWHKYEHSVDFASKIIHLPVRDFINA